MKTVRLPPYPKWNPGYFPCSSLTPLPLSSRRPSVSFGGFGLSYTGSYVAQRLLDQGVRVRTLTRSPDSDDHSFAHVYWNGPDRLRDDNKTLLPGNAINSIAVTDFDNDGRLDLFVASYHDGQQRDIDSYIYWQRETGFSAADRTRMPTHSASGCIAADFDGDGWIDLAIGYHRVEAEHKAHSAVWWNGPEGFSDRRVTTLPTDGPHGISNIEPGSITDRGPEEHYVSLPFQLPPGEVVQDVSWEASVPSGTWVEAHLRFAASESGLTAAPWLAPREAAAHPGKWLQYRLSLGADKAMSTPRVTEVRVSYAKQPME